MRCTPDIRNKRVEGKYNRKKKHAQANTSGWRVVVGDRFSDAETKGKGGDPAPDINF